MTRPPTPPPRPQSATPGAQKRSPPGTPRIFLQKIDVFFKGFVKLGVPCARTITPFVADEDRVQPVRPLRHPLRPARAEALPVGGELGARLEHEGVPALRLQKVDAQPAALARNGLLCRPEDVLAGQHVQHGDGAAWAHTKMA